MDNDIKTWLHDILMAIEEIESLLEENNSENENKTDSQK